MANKHIKRCSTSLMQIKTTMKYHFTLVRMAVTKISTNNNAGKGVKKRELSFNVVHVLKPPQFPLDCILVGGAVPPIIASPSKSSGTPKSCIFILGQSHSSHNFKEVVVVQLLSRVQLLQPHGLQPTRLLCPWDSPGKNTRVGCHFLLQGIFLTQESNPGLMHCRQILY